MVKRIALAALAVSSALILLGLFVDHAAAAWMATVLIALQPALLIALGACREGRLESLGRAVWALLGMLAIVSLLLLWLSSQDPPLTLAGLPASLLVAVIGLWLLPLVLTSIAYVATFERFSLRREDLTALRRLRDRRSPQPQQPGETDRTEF